MNKYEREMNKIQRKFEADIKKLAKKFRKEVIIPTCKKLNLDFEDGYFWDSKYSYAKYNGIDKILETVYYDSCSYNMFVGLIADYYPNRK